MLGFRKYTVKYLEVMGQGICKWLKKRLEGESVCLCVYRVRVHKRHTVLTMGESG